MPDSSIISACFKVVPDGGVISFNLRLNAGVFGSTKIWEQAMSLKFTKVPESATQDVMPIAVAVADIIKRTFDAWAAHKAEPSKESTQAMLDDIRTQIAVTADGWDFDSLSVHLREDAPTKCA